MKNTSAEIRKKIISFVNIVLQEYRRPTDEGIRAVQAPIRYRDFFLAGITKEEMVQIQTYLFQEGVVGRAEVLKPMDAETFCPRISEEDLKKLKKFKREHPLLQDVGIRQTGIFLDGDGNLYREPEKQLRYPIGSGSQRLRIVRHLAEGATVFTPTKNLASALGHGNVDTLRKEIGKINDNAMNKLKIGKKKEPRGRIDPLIEGRSHSGYRINPKYHIEILRE